MEAVPFRKLGNFYPGWPRIKCAIRFGLAQRSGHPTPLLIAAAVREQPSGTLVHLIAPARATRKAAFHFFALSFASTMITSPGGSRPNSLECNLCGHFQAHRHDNGAAARRSPNGTTSVLS